jgi:23S rRNA pseudouridine1911/1915/1917 synthase
VPSPESRPASNHHDFAVAADDAGQRLDRAIATRLPDLSRTRVQELINAQLILINGGPAKGSHRLRVGEHVTIQIQPRPPIRAEAESIPLDILYEDDDVIAVNKPAGMTVHPGAGTHSGTLVNALLGRGQVLSQGGDALRPGIVHRLDKDTSGLILVAKNDAAHAKLGEAFRRREVKKTYIALVHGPLKPDHGRINFAIGRDPKRRARRGTAPHRPHAPDSRPLFRTPSPRRGRRTLRRTGAASRGRKQDSASYAGPKFPARSQTWLHPASHWRVD